MNRKYLLGTLAAACMVAITTTAAAQSTSNGTGTSTVSTQSNQSTESSNSGVQAQVYQFGATKMAESVNSQVPISLSGYGSFSQNGCESSFGLGATTKVFSLIYNAPKPEQNCQHAVRSDEFGRESNLAISHGKPVQSEDLRAISVWEACTSEDDTATACIMMGKIAYIDPQHPDIHKTKPVPFYTEDADTRVNAQGQLYEVPPPVPTEKVTVQASVADRSEAIARAQAESGQGMHGVAH
jgi:hypothetical protein